jgi:hypothetical protein
MPGGLLGLVAYGNMNRLVSGNPQTTYFYKAFTRYTHYSQENITVPLDGPNELSVGAPIQLRAKIPRHGDLVSDMYLTVNLPAIYNKIQPGRVSHEFAWVRQVGIRMIDRIGLYIGGSKVQEYSSDWLAMKFQLDQPLDAFEKWSSMIGDRPELFDPASGPYADLSGGYPNVVEYPNIGTNQTNNPSIPAQTLNIPLGFFFSDAPGLALPLIALQYHDVEVQITMRPLRQIYTIKDPNGVRVQWGYHLDSAQGTAIYNQSWNKNLGPLPESLNNNYMEYYDPSGSPRFFYTDVGYGIPATDGFQLNPRLQCTYIFLTDDERRIFASKRLEYMVRQVQEFQFQNILSRRLLLIDAHSLITRFIWFGRRSDWYYRNDYANLTNWKYTDPRLRPWAKAPLSTQSNGGVLIPGTGKNIMTSARILCGGNEIFEEKDASYFTQIVPYKTCLGNGYPNLLGGILEPVSLSPIYVYSFALNSSVGNQPSGTFNCSKITRTELEINVQQLPADVNYSYNFSVFAESLNFLEIGSGMGGMKFAI